MVLIPLLKSEGVYDTFQTANSILPIFWQMQQTGIPGSRSKFISLSKQIKSDMRRIKAQIEHDYYNGQTFNPNSPDDVASLMRRRRLPAAKRTKGGKVSTSKQSIGHLLDDDAMGLVSDYREMSKIKGTYCEPILHRIKRTPINPKYPDQIIIKTKIKPVTVATRRLSTEDPNVLGLPSRTELGKRFRACYEISDPDLVFVAVDYGSQEMRVAAHVSQDELLMDLLWNEGDPHKTAASIIFNVPYEEVTGVQRRAAKTINFGILYGMGGSGLQAQLRTEGLVFPLSECDRMARSVLRDVYVGIAEKIKKTTRDLKDTGVISDLFGFPRYIPKIWSTEEKERAEAGREGFSHLVQGTAQGMIQNAMAWLRDQIRAMQKMGVVVEWCLEFHDELLMICDKKIANVVAELIKESFVNHSGIKLDVPITADVHIGRNLAELK